MDDFLYNLRRESDKRNRRQGGQQQYRGPDRRGGKEQRRPYQKRYDATELSSEIKTLLETLNENQKMLIENDNRKIRALEDIADALQSLTGGVSPARIKKIVAKSTSAEEMAVETSPISTEASATPVESLEPTADTAETSPKDASPAEDDAKQSPEKPMRSEREDVRKIALSLREKGKTYKEIARHLDEQGIPTFSGKGGWHAPTIHKLCK